MTTEEIVTLLSATELFAPLSAEEICQLAQNAVVRIFGSGRIIVRQGDAGSSMFVVLLGRVLIKYDGATIATLGTGDYFGEMAVLRGAPYSATVSAEEKTKVLEIRVEVIRRLFEANPDLAGAIAWALIDLRTPVGASAQMDGNSQAEQLEREINDHLSQPVKSLSSEPDIKLAAALSQVDNDWEREQQEGSSGFFATGKHFFGLGALSSSDNSATGKSIEPQLNPKEPVKLAPVSHDEAEKIVSQAMPSMITHSRQQDGPAESDIVVCTVFAPPRVNVVDEKNFMVQVFAHLFEQAEEAKNLAKEFDDSAERRGSKSLETEVARGTKLTFHLSMRNLEVDDPVQTLVWRGRPESVQFVVSHKKTSGKIAGTVTVSQDNVPIGQISFNVLLLSRHNSGEPEALGAAVHFQQAFISYASQDRNEVLKRVQMLSRLKVNFFQDVLNLEPGARWEQALYRHIDECDMFLLFWSTAARNSKWVLEEVRYALNRKGGSEGNPPAIIPIIIEGPPPVEPPEELSHLHFNDYTLYFQDKTTASQYFDELRLSRMKPSHIIRRLKRLIQ